MILSLRLKYADSVSAGLVAPRDSGERHCRIVAAFTLYSLISQIVLLSIHNPLLRKTLTILKILLRHLVISNTDRFDMLSAG